MYDNNPLPGPRTPTCSGKYTLLAGDFVEIELDTAWNGLKKHREKITVVGNRLTLRDSDGTTVEFYRGVLYNGLR